MSKRRYRERSTTVVLPCSTSYAYTIISLVAELDWVSGTTSFMELYVSRRNTERFLVKLKSDTNTLQITTSFHIWHNPPHKLIAPLAGLLKDV